MCNKPIKYIAILASPVRDYVFVKKLVCSGVKGERDRK